MTQQQSRSGQQLGHYHLLHLLGSGGFADVYLCEHIHLRTQSAIKVLHAHLADAEIEAFRREAQTVAFLRHPSIVRVLDFGVEERIPYLVMDFAPNGSLRHRYPKGTFLALKEVATLLLQVASALQYAHDHRLIHRDVKPENMLLGPRFEVLLSDFGLALLTQSSQSQSAQNIAGTIAYMAPEQIQAHPRPASDQYALAIVAYEWLCGHPPFQGSYMEIAVKHALTPPPALRDLHPHLPLAIERVVLKALHKDPQQRFESVQLFAQAFAQATQIATQAQHSSTFVPPPSVPAPNPNPTFGQTPPQYPSFAASSMNTALMGPPQPAAPSAYPSGTATAPGYANITPPPVWSGPSTNAPYTLTPPPSQPIGQLLQPATSRPIARSRRSFITGGIAGLVVAAGVGAWLYTQRSNGAQTGNTKLPAGGSPAASSSPSSSPAVIPGATAPLLTYTGHSGLVFAISWSPDGTLIASGSENAECQVWSADAGKLIFSIRSTLQPPISSDFVQTLAWSRHTQQRLAVAFLDGTIQVFDIDNRQRVSALTQSYQTNGVLSWSPDGKYIAVCKSIIDHAVVIYEVATWNIVTTYQDHADSVHAVAWSPDGKHIASGSDDTTIRVWEPFTGQTSLIYKEHNQATVAISWSSDSTKIVSSAQDYLVRIWQIDTGKTLFMHQYPQRAPMGKVMWSHNNQFVAAYYGTGAVDILDAQLAVKQTIPAGVTYDFSWSPDDTRIATANYNNIAQIWHVGT